MKDENGIHLINHDCREAPFFILHNSSFIFYHAWN